MAERYLMRIGNLNDRLVLIDGQNALDVHGASEGRFGPDPQSAYADWSAFATWAAGADTSAARPFAAADLGAPVPAPRQVFAIGLNYREHALEANMGIPEQPVVFTKFPSCLAGPECEVEVLSQEIDWEAELVVVISTGGHDIALEDAWDHVAGYTIGQDLSERILQRSGPAPQFGLAKSYPNFGPTGPAVVTLDEVTNRDDLAISCAIDGETMQDGRTNDLIFPVDEIVSRLSRIVSLYPGDLIFTGTPSGVGLGRSPQRFLQPGEELVTTIEGLGELRQRFVAPSGAPAGNTVSPSTDASA